MQLTTRLGISGTIEEWQVVNHDRSIAKSCKVPKSNLITNAGLDMFCTTNITTFICANYTVFGNDVTCPNISDPSVSTLDSEKVRVGTGVPHSYDPYWYPYPGGDIIPSPGSNPFVVERHFAIETTEGQLDSTRDGGGYTEIGFSPSATIGYSLFSKFRIVDNDGVPISLDVSSTQFLRIKYCVTIDIPATTYTGSILIQDKNPLLPPLGTFTFVAGWQYLNATSAFDTICRIHTSTAESKNFTVFSSTWPWQNIGYIINDPSWSTSEYQQYTARTFTYVPGSYYIDRQIDVLAGSQCNWVGGIKTIILNNPPGSYWRPWWALVFDTSVHKISTYVMTLKFRFSWGRST